MSILGIVIILSIGKGKNNPLIPPIPHVSFFTFSVGMVG